MPLQQQKMISDEEEVSNQSINKMKKSLHSQGYREGLASGREMKFQHGFDEGFAKGFHAGYALGLHNGLLSCLKSDLSTIKQAIKNQLSTIDQVDKASRGLCVICSQEKEFSLNSDCSESQLEMQQITEIKQLQGTIICERINQMLTKDYSSILKSNRLDGLLTSL